jgi:adenine phosphoribosyltransferase
MWWAWNRGALSLARLWLIKWEWALFLSANRENCLEKFFFAEYELEYGVDRLEMHRDAMKPGSRVLVVDDLIATGGTAAATANLLQQAGCELVGFAFVIELLALGGRQKLPDVPIVTLVEY